MASTDTGLKFLKRQGNRLSQGEVRNTGKITPDEATQSEGAQAMWRASHAISDTAEDAKASKNLRANMREIDSEAQAQREAEGKKKGGEVKGYAKGGVTRADGCITKGHTKGRIV